jgi:CheY-like chemotaxis protein
MIPTIPATTIRTPVRILRAENPALDRVLVAEDHQPTREALRTLLELKGFQVTAVGDGSDAIECLSDPDGPAIGIINWMMPGASGVEVCRAVRAAVPARYVYLIMVTARDREEDVAEALAVGADDFIRKPCGPTELVARVRCGRRTIELKQSLAGRVAELEGLVERIRQLKRLLPICMYCKKVRNDSDYWQEIEAYLHQETGTDFSHGICPDCMPNALRGLDEPALPARPPVGPN